jgi:hypothetical protein
MHGGRLRPVGTRNDMGGQTARQAEAIVPYGFSRRRSFGRRWFAGRAASRDVAFFIANMN